MHGFTQYTPTRIIFGKETQKQAGELAKSLKASKVFVVYGGGSVVRSGLLDEVIASLEEAGLEYDSWRREAESKAFICERSSEEIH